MSHSRTKLAEYLREAGIYSSRKTSMMEEEQVQHILDEMAKDPKQSRGPRDIKETLVLMGVHIPQ